MEEDHLHSARETTRTFHSLEDVLRSLLVESVQGSATTSRGVVLQCTIPQGRDQLPQDSFLALQVHVPAGRLLMSFLQVFRKALLLGSTFAGSSPVPRTTQLRSCCLD
jgi:hypothetical protein